MKEMSLAVAIVTATAEQHAEDRLALDELAPCPRPAGAATQ